MATRRTTITIDDLDGELLPAGTRPVRFALDGRAYEIDLSEDHAAELRLALRPYVDAARRASEPRRRRSV